MGKKYDDMAIFDDRGMRTPDEEELGLQQEDQSFLVLDWYVYYLNLARELLKASCAENGQRNVIVSPFSLYVLLVLAMNATAGQSQKEIKEVVAKDYTIKNLTDRIRSFQKDACMQMKGGKLASSNGICVEASIFDKILPEFKEGTGKALDAEFFSGGDNAVQRINDWVKIKTDGMIEKLLDDTPISFKACLMNAIAFEAKWLEPYEKYDIKENRDFTNVDGSMSKVTMLSSDEQGYIEDEFFTGFVKPYKGGKYELMCLLPNKKKSQTFFNRAIENIDFQKYYMSLDHQYETSVLMPEFEYSTESELKELCMKQGIHEIFTPSGNFGGMLKAEAGPIMVDSILQKAYIKVNREGTKAAAVTGMVCAAGCAPEFDRFKYVTLDRPFVYAIMEKGTKLPVFVGVVNKL